MIQRQGISLQLTSITSCWMDYEMMKRVYNADKIVALSTVSKIRMVLTFVQKLSTSTVSVSIHLSVFGQCQYLGSSSLKRPI